jgi:hypothetical protein
LFLESGGGILIPKLHNGKNKTFIWVDEVVSSAGAVLGNL